MSVDQYLRVAADNVVRAISELKIETDRYRSEIDRKKREVADRERSLNGEIQRDTSNLSSNSDDPTMKAAHIAHAQKVRHDIDQMHNSLNNEINSMSRTISSMEGMIRDLENKAGSLRHASGI